MKVLIVVTHLLGTGHLSRALTLARAFQGDGHSVRLASGGMPVAHLGEDGVEVVQLPPLRSDGVDFTRLLDENDQIATPDLLARRTQMLCDTLRDDPPDIVICELFPFGRRSLAPEFMALLTAAQGLARRPVVLCSIRDILAPPSKPEKAQRADAILAQYFDAVLVHSDPRATPLERSWPVSDITAPLLRYTGYVAPTPAGPHPDGTGTGEVLVSAGGGGVGQSLFRTALGAAALAPDLHWRLLIGGADAAAQIAELTAMGLPGNVTLNPTRPDFRQMLTGAAASVSMCGYNTALDLMQAGTPTVFVPFDAGNETEQTLRATSLATLPAIRVLPAATLSAAALYDGVRNVIRDGRRTGTDLRFDGAAQSVAIARDLAQARP